MVRRLLPPVIFLIAGCASAPPIASVPVEVRVPVYQPVYCAIQAPERPVLPIASLNQRSTPAETIRAYAASVALLKGAVIQLEAVLAGCADPEGATLNQGPAKTGMHG